MTSGQFYSSCSVGRIHLSPPFSCPEPLQQDLPTAPLPPREWVPCRPGHRRYGPVTRHGQSPA